MVATRARSLPDPIRSRSATLRRALTALLVVVAALIVLERFSLAAIALHRDGVTGDTLRQLARAAAAALPEACYLAALWWVRQALAAFARGELYSPTIATALHRVGIALAIGGVLAVFVLPTTMRVLGAPPGFVIAYDIGAVVIAAVGASLTVLAHVLRRAHAIETELGEMF